SPQSMRRSPRDPRIIEPAGQVKWRPTWGTGYYRPLDNGLKRYHTDSEIVGQSPATSLECRRWTSESSSDLLSQTVHIASCWRLQHFGA
ncbi:mCG145024, partial [Mus musculus]